VANYQSQAI